MNQNSIKWIFILLGLFVMMTFVSCQDDVAQEEQLIKCTPGGSYVTSNIPAVAFNDSIFGKVAVRLDIDKVNHGWWKEVYQDAAEVILVPYPDEEPYKLQVGDSIDVSVTLWTKAQYQSDSNTAYFYARITMPQAESRASYANETEMCKVLGEIEPMITSRSESSTAYKFDKRVRTYIHIIRNVDGSGIIDPVKEGNQVIQAANNYFSNTGISFFIEEYLVHNYYTEEMKNSYYLDNLEENDPIFYLDSHSDGIDIYVLSHVDSGRLSGVSLQTNGSIVAKYTTNNTISHEIGHSLGLYHTHKGTCQGYGGNYSDNDKGVAEFVDGSNALTSGDFCSDTPADPCLWDADGNYIGGVNIVDGHGDRYNPDPFNIMSYSIKGNHFSEEQINKMHYRLTYDSVRRAWLGNPVIEGPLHFESSGLYSLKSLADNTNDLIWAIKRHRSPSNYEDQPEEIVTEYYDISNNPLKISSLKSEYIEIGVKEKSSNECFTTIKATTNAPSPYTGSLLWTTDQGQTSWNESYNMNWGAPLVLRGSAQIYLDYRDRANATLQNISFMTVTAAHRVLRGSTITVTSADCSLGYLKFRISDSCGQSDGYFTLPVSVIGGYYAINIESDSVSFTPTSGTFNSVLRENVNAQIPMIAHIKIINATGEIVLDKDGEGTNPISINTLGWSQGEYTAVISDEKNNMQEIQFVI